MQIELDSRYLKNPVIVLRSMFELQQLQRRIRFHHQGCDYCGDDLDGRPTECEVGELLRRINKFLIEYDIRELPKEHSGTQVYYRIDRR